MPFYEYVCGNCRRYSRIHLSYAEYDTATPTCKHCGSKHLRRRVSRVALAKQEEDRVDALMDETALADLDEEDPRSIGKFMRRMSRELGEDMGDEFEEVVDRLESGESPESIEESMPDLGSETMPGDSPF